MGTTVETLHSLIFGGSAIPRCYKFGATPLACCFRGEKIIFQIEGFGGALSEEAHIVLPRDLGEAPGDIGAAGKDHAFDLRPDRRQRGTRPVAAIKQRREMSVGHGLACGGDKPAVPPGTDVNSGIGSARKDYPSVETRRGTERADRVRERVDDDNDNGITRWLPLTPALSPHAGRGW
jgi:hypothetical protein